MEGWRWTRLYKAGHFHLPLVVELSAKALSLQSLEKQVIIKTYIKLIMMILL